MNYLRVSEIGFKRKILAESRSIDRQFCATLLPYAFANEQMKGFNVALRQFLAVQLFGVHHPLSAHILREAHTLQNAEKIFGLTNCLSCVF